MLRPLFMREWDDKNIKSPGEGLAFLTLSSCHDAPTVPGDGFRGTVASDRMMYLHENDGGGGGNFFARLPYPVDRCRRAHLPERDTPGAADAAVAASTATCQALGHPGGVVVHHAPRTTP